MKKPLDQFPVIRTRNADQLRDTLINVYGAHYAEFPGNTSNLDAHANHVQLRHLALSYCTHGTEIQFSFPEANFLRQQFCIRGKGQITTTRGAASFDRELSCVTAAATGAKLDLGDTLEQLVLRVPQRLLQDKIASLLGSRFRSDIQFELASNLKSPKGSHLRNLVWFLTQTLDDSGLMLPPVAIEELEQSIALAFLYGNRNSASALLEQNAASVAPWQVRLAEEYIEAHWSEPLTIEILSSAIGASIRSIFKSFADHRGYTPTDFLRSVRLRQARAMLQKPELRATVTGVGLKCGFLNLGHFARHYQVKFGELPSVTLTRAKGPNIGGPLGKEDLH